MKILRYNSIDDFKTITSMSDFYERAGISYKDDLTGKSKCIADSVYKIYMEEEDCKQLLEFLKKNQKLQKNYTLKNCSKDYYDSSVGFDWLNYSPSTKLKEIPKGEIWLDI